MIKSHRNVQACQNNTIATTEQGDAGTCLTSWKPNANLIALTTLRKQTFNAALKHLHYWTTMFPMIEILKMVIFLRMSYVRVVDRL